MNKGVEKSFKLAASRGYLDKLFAIYPVAAAVRRKISKKVKEDIARAFKSKDKKDLILTLLRLDRFPVDEPCLGFIRKDISALDRNPKTLARISSKLKALGLKGVLEGITRPKSSSRRMGPMFKKWLEGLGYPILSAQEIKKTRSRVAILKGSDAALKNFAKKELGYKREKGLDLVMKVGSHFMIGEAKLISTGGGTQDKSFREAVSFVKQKKNKAIRIAVLDGVVWIPSGQEHAKEKMNLYSTIKDLSRDQFALSALLLKDFIKAQIYRKQ
ncbi:MAG: hypothetical protein A3A43_03355 [Candidatus Liptonbacteria bacterium RIFCSPLOWO2_01_FULL_56_20]|uniref:Restriction endonuclease n=1 Tax=Candidatus Liptonbacteria bacterium RIFCSPLOWO2_01_FULL_56_20 TaxID=1798652 RepID=A0A1G2CM78_9BACT|nr:MAG: hypothetical protein A3A43_03355 [Candidatus Liptonbacteria bacterium RIFCSPLOWO2_01_FULL_56_20]